MSPAYRVVFSDPAMLGALCVRFLAIFSHRIPTHLDAMGVVHETVEEAVGSGKPPIRFPNVFQKLFFAPHAMLGSQCLAGFYWPVFSCPSLAGFGCPPRLRRILKTRDRVGHRDYRTATRIDVARTKAPRTCVDHGGARRIPRSHQRHWRSDIESYKRALKGVPATQRGREPIEPTAPYLLHDVARILMECALRPDEAYRLSGSSTQCSLWISHEKTDNARRVIPLSQRAAAIVEMRRTSALDRTWVFPAPTASGHSPQHVAMFILALRLYSKQSDAQRDSRVGTN
jgi:hypothetical protein